MQPAENQARNLRAESEVVENLYINYATPVLPYINLQFLQQTRIG